MLFRSACLALELTAPSAAFSASSTLTSPILLALESSSSWFSSRSRDLLSTAFSLSFAPHRLGSIGALLASTSQLQKAHRIRAASLPSTPCFSCSPNSRYPHLEIPQQARSRSFTPSFRRSSLLFGTLRYDLTSSNPVVTDDPGFVGSCPAEGWDANPGDPSPLSAQTPSS